MRCVVVAIGLLATGCGRPATEAECVEIVARIAELEMKAATAASPSAVAAEVQAAKTAFKGEALRDCVGKRIRDESLRCVRAAKSAQQIVDECFD